MMTRSGLSRSAALLLLLMAGASLAHAQSGSMQDMDMRGMDMGKTGGMVMTAPASHRRTSQRASLKAPNPAHAKAATPLMPSMDAMAGMPMGSMTISGMSMAAMSGMHGMGGPDVLASAAPADGQTLQGSPGAFSLAFKQPVRVQSLQIFDSTGARVPIAPPAPEAASRVSTRLPDLPPDTYEARWRALTADGQTASGAVHFVVG